MEPRKAKHDNFLPKPTTTEMDEKVPSRRKERGKEKGDGEKKEEETGFSKTSYT